MAGSSPAMTESVHRSNTKTLGINYWREMARVTGLEPATSGVTGRRSNQLSYTRFAVSAVRICGERRCNPHAIQRQAEGLGIGGDGFEPPTLSV